MKPGALLAALKSRAREFVKQIPQPKPGEFVPEALLCAFELARHGCRGGRSNTQLRITATYNP